MITLRPMTEDEFARFRAFMYEDYAQAVSRGMGLPIEQARTEAARQIDTLFKDGLRTEGHLLWKLVSPADGVVGDPWVHLRTAEYAWIYFIVVDEPHRGKSYAKEALYALEAELKPRGVTRIGLNVFGDNTTAQALYTRVGYRPAAITMQKDI